LNELSSLFVVFRSIHYNSSSSFFSLFYRRQIFLRVDGLRNESSCICFDKHQFQNINLFIGDPCMVKLLQVLTHLVKNILDRDIDFFHYAFVDVSYYLLNNFELLE